VNEEMLRLGFARSTLGGSDPQYQKCSMLTDTAKKNKLGVWGGQGTTKEDSYIRRIVEGAEQERMTQAGIASG
jgi:hypothetical protein